MKNILAIILIAITSVCFGQRAEPNMPNPNLYANIVSLPLLQNNQWDSIVKSARESTDNNYALEIDKLTREIDIPKTEIDLKKMEILLIQGLVNCRHDALCRLKFNRAHELKKEIAELKIKYNLL